MRMRTMSLLAALVCFSYAGVGGAGAGALPRWAPPASVRTQVTNVRCTGPQVAVCVEQGRSQCERAVTKPGMFISDQHMSCLVRARAACVARCGGE
jgi:hypothetical protein